MKPKKEKQKKRRQRGSNKKETFIVVNSRDLNIFKIMSCGAMELGEIRKLLKVIYKEDMSLKALSVRIGRLRSGGYIQSRLYVKQIEQSIPNPVQGNSESIADENTAGDKKARRKIVAKANLEKARRKTKTFTFALYALTPLAVGELIGIGYSSGMSIRYLLPGAKFVTHDALIRDTMRAIKREQAQIGYSLTILDDITIRKKDKMHSIPDLLVQIHIPAGGTPLDLTLYIELDNGTESIDYVINKIRGLQGDILYIVNSDKERLEKIAKGVEWRANLDETGQLSASHKRKGGEGFSWGSIKDRLYFSYFKDFVNKGLFETTFISCTDEKRILIPSSFKKKIVIHTTRHES